MVRGRPWVVYEVAVAWATSSRRALSSGWETGEDKYSVLREHNSGNSAQGCAAATLITEIEEEGTYPHTVLERYVAVRDLPSIRFDLMWPIHCRYM